jgi:hypothetical protein
MSEGWEAAFVAVGTIAGEPSEAIASALGDEGVARVADLLRALAVPSREARGQAMARAVSEVVLAIDASRYA